MRPPIGRVAALSIGGWPALRIALKRFANCLSFAWFGPGGTAVAPGLNYAARTCVLSFSHGSVQEALR